MDYSTSLPKSEPFISEASAFELGLVGRGYNGRQVLFDLINLTSSFKYEMSHGWDFTPPRRMPQGSKFNTVCEMINGVKDSGLFSMRTVYYNRIHTSDLGSLVLPKGSATLVSDLIDAINLALSTSLSSFEIIDAQLPNPDGAGNVTFNLTFFDSSMQYYSGEKIIPATVVSPDGVSQPVATAIAQAVATVEQFVVTQISTAITNSGGLSPDAVIDGQNF